MIEIWPCELTNCILASLRSTFSSHSCSHKQRDMSLRVLGSGQNPRIIFHITTRESIVWARQSWPCQESGEGLPDLSVEPYGTVYWQPSRAALFCPSWLRCHIPRSSWTAVHNYGRNPDDTQIIITSTYSSGATLGAFKSTREIKAYRLHCDARTV